MIMKCWYTHTLFILSKGQKGEEGCVHEYDINMCFAV